MSKGAEGGRSWCAIRVPGVKLALPYHPSMVSRDPDDAAETSVEGKVFTACMTPVYYVPAYKLHENRISWSFDLPVAAAAKYQKEFRLFRGVMGFGFDQAREQN